MDSIQGGGLLAILQYMKDGLIDVVAGYGISLKKKLEILEGSIGDFM